MFDMPKGAKTPKNMGNAEVDGGIGVDWGKTSRDYAEHRPATELLPKTSSARNWPARAKSPRPRYRHRRDCAANGTPRLRGLGHRYFTDAGENGSNLGR